MQLCIADAIDSFKSGQQFSYIVLIQAFSHYDLPGMTWLSNSDRYFINTTTCVSTTLTTEKLVNSSDRIRAIQFKIRWLLCQSLAMSSEYLRLQCVYTKTEP